MSNRKVETQCDATAGLPVDPAIVNAALSGRLFLQAEWLLERTSKELEQIIELITHDVTNLLKQV